ncbi:hypothetical protein RHSIM_Rhsim04G0083000 [Rhododendron simsii]|uniref:GDSL esterase/lipase n=1 Tax=Rhododendron simsii TaxID=118357 RepID=A0A834H3C0_RHOSS|nr:hypothetical protein RHSIM_Rhsim04G0083000 [Rhododendron simsii]
MANTSATLWVILTQFLLLVFVEGKNKVPAIIVFGDSSVDAGNNNQIPTIARSNFEPYGRDFDGGRPTGRFSNGRILTNFISKVFGLRTIVPAYLDPAYSIKDFVVGVTFASAGTGYDNATSDVLSTTRTTKKKLKAYLGEDKAKQTLAQALYVMSLGTNDFLENYYTLPDRRSQYNINQYQVFLIGIAMKFVENLYGLGARKISLGGLPPMGCLPLERTTNFMGGKECMQSYNIVATAFNARLTSSVASSSPELSILLRQDKERAHIPHFSLLTSLSVCSSGASQLMN